ncbi:MAG: hypothetical protein R2706_12620 [Acidimicrobiales bacterium]
MQQLQVGHVIAFDPAVGTGTVESDGGNVWLFHLTSIADGSRSIDDGQRVAFVVGPGGPGQWEAAQIIKL